MTAGQAAEYGRKAGDSAGGKLLSVTQEDVYQLLGRANIEVEKLRKLVPEARVFKRQCSDILDASNVCLRQLEQSLALSLRAVNGAVNADPDQDQQPLQPASALCPAPEQLLLPAAAKLLLAARSACHRVGKLGRPVGVRRLLAWAKHRSHKEKLEDTKYDMMATLDYATAAAAAARAAVVAASPSSSPSKAAADAPSVAPAEFASKPAAVLANKGLIGAVSPLPYSYASDAAVSAAAAPAALAVLNFAPGTLRRARDGTPSMHRNGDHLGQPDQGRLRRRLGLGKSPAVAAVRFVPAGGLGGGGGGSGGSGDGGGGSGSGGDCQDGEAAVLLLVQLTSGAVEVFSPMARGFSSRLLLRNPAAASGRAPPSLSAAAGVQGGMGGSGVVRLTAMAVEWGATGCNMGLGSGPWGAVGMGAGEGAGAGAGAGTGEALMWCGFSDGSVALAGGTPTDQCGGSPGGLPVSRQVSGAAITCAHAAPGRLWLGDLAGHVTCVQSEPARMARVANPRGTSHHSPSAVTCIWALPTHGSPHLPLQLQGTAAVAADAAGLLMLICGTDYSVTDTFDCRSQFGAVTCIADVPWGAARSCLPPAACCPGEARMTGRGHDSGTAAAAYSPALTPRVAATISLTGPATAAATAAAAHTGNSTMNGAVAAAANAASASSGSSSSGSSFRLVTGHSSGVLVVWEVAGGRLRPMGVMGAEQPAAAISCLCVLPELRLLVSGHRAGLLRVWPLPAPRMHLLPLPGPATPQWNVRHGAVRAHKGGGLVGMDRCGPRLVTCCQGGAVKVWDVLELRARALRQGAVLEPLTQPITFTVTAAPPASTNPSAATASMQPTHRAAALGGQQQPLHTTQPRMQTETPPAAAAAAATASPRAGTAAPAGTAAAAVAQGPQLPPPPRRTQHVRLSPQHPQPQLQHHLPLQPPQLVPLPQPASPGPHPQPCFPFQQQQQQLYPSPQLPLQATISAISAAQQAASASSPASSSSAPWLQGAGGSGGGGGSVSGGGSLGGGSQLSTVTHLTAFETSSAAVAAAAAAYRMSFNSSGGGSSISSGLGSRSGGGSSSRSGGGAGAVGDMYGRALMPPLPPPPMLLPSTSPPPGAVQVPLAAAAACAGTGGAPMWSLGPPLSLMGTGGGVGARTLDSVPEEEVTPNVGGGCDHDASGGGGGGGGSGGASDCGDPLVSSSWCSGGGGRGGDRGGSGGGGRSVDGLGGGLLGEAEASPLLELRNQFLKDSELELQEEIGTGAEGRVWRGRWHHINVAVKEMRALPGACLQRGGGGGGSGAGAAAATTGAAAGVPSRELQALIQEVSALVDLSQHPNIVRFIGLCLQPPRLVTEYYPRGCLFSLVQRAREGCDGGARAQLDWLGRLGMAHDIAAGMAFLHDRQYVHGDLRSPNVFVCQEGRAKVGDFGFAQLRGGQPAAAAFPSAAAAAAAFEAPLSAPSPCFPPAPFSSASISPVPPWSTPPATPPATPVARVSNPRWLAPEVILTQRSSRQGDVFSFAIIMFELLTWQVPYEGYDGTQVVVQHSTWAQQQHHLQLAAGAGAGMGAGAGFGAGWCEAAPPFRPQLPPDSQLPQVPPGSDSLAAYKQLMAECWAQNLEDRPSFSQIAGRLHALIQWERAVAAVHDNVSALLMMTGASSGGGSGGAAAGGAGQRDGRSEGDPHLFLTATASADLPTPSMHDAGAAGAVGAAGAAGAVLRSRGSSLLQLRGPEASLSPAVSDNTAAEAETGAVSTQDVAETAPEALLLRPCDGSFNLRCDATAAAAASPPMLTPQPQPQTQPQVLPGLSPPASGGSGFMSAGGGTVSSFFYTPSAYPPTPVPYKTPASAAAAASSAASAGPSAGGGGSSAASATPTMDLLIADASGIHRISGIPLTGGSRSSFTGSGGANAFNTRSGGAASGANGGVGGGAAMEASGEVDAAAAAAEAADLTAAAGATAAGVLAAVVGGRSRRATTLQMDTGQVILLLTEEDEEGDGAQDREEELNAQEEAPAVTAETVETLSPAAMSGAVSGAAAREVVAGAAGAALLASGQADSVTDAEQSDAVGELPHLLRHLFVSQHQLQQQQHLLRRQHSQGDLEEGTKDAAEAAEAATPEAAAAPGSVPLPALPQPPGTATPSPLSGSLPSASVTSATSASASAAAATAVPGFIASPSASLSMSSVSATSPFGFTRGRAAAALAAAAAAAAAGGGGGSISGPGRGSGSLGGGGGGGRRSSSAGSGVVVALASLRSSAGPGSGSTASLGKGTLSLKAMSSLVAAIRVLPEEVASSLLAETPGMQQQQPATWATTLSGGGGSGYSSGHHRGYHGAYGVSGVSGGGGGGGNSHDGGGGGSVSPAATNRIRLSYGTTAATGEAVASVGSGHYSRQLARGSGSGSGSGCYAPSLIPQQQQQHPRRSSLGPSAEALAAGGSSRGGSRGGGGGSGSGMLLPYDGVSSNNSRGGSRGGVTPLASSRGGHMPSVPRWPLTYATEAWSPNGAGAENGSDGGGGDGGGSPLSFAAASPTLYGSAGARGDPGSEGACDNSAGEAAIDTAVSTPTLASRRAAPAVAVASAAHAAAVAPPPPAESGPGSGGYGRVVGVDGGGDMALRPSTLSPAVPAHQTTTPAAAAPASWTAIGAPGGGEGPSAGVLHSPWANAALVAAAMGGGELEEEGATAAAAAVSTTAAKEGVAAPELPNPFFNFLPVEAFEGLRAEGEGSRDGAVTAGGLVDVSRRGR